MAYCKKIADIEKKIALELIEGFSLYGDHSFQDSPFIQECLKRNNDLKRLRPVETFAVVGAGSIPSTLLKAGELGLFKEYVAFDVDPEAKELGSQVLEKWGYKGQYHLGDGCSLSYGDYETIYIANLVQGKESVLKRVHETCRDDAQVVIRLTSSGGDSDVDCFSLDAINERDWKILERGEPSKEFKSFNVFLRKNTQD